MNRSTSPRPSLRRPMGAAAIALSLLFASCGSADDGSPEQAIETPATTEKAAVLFPIDTGELENWRAALADLSGPNYADYESSRARFGLTQQTTVLQETPMGNFALIYMEGLDLAETSRLMATSGDEWDIGWREMTTGLHGVDFNDQAALSFDAHLVLDTGDLTDEDKQSTIPFNFFIPLDPLRAVDIRAELQAVMDDQGDAYRSARVAIGVAEEKVFLQDTIVGPGLVIYWEAADPAASLERLLISQDPFDVWFAAQFSDAHAVPTVILADIWSRNELVADFPKRS